MARALPASMPVTTGGVSQTRERRHCQTVSATAHPVSTSTMTTRKRTTLHCRAEKYASQATAKAMAWLCEARGGMRRP